MKQVSKVRNVLSAFALALVVLAGTATSVYAAASSSATPASRPSSSGPQAQAPVKAGSKDAKATQALGSTRLAATNSDGTPKAASIARVGAVAGVDFQASLNYCWRNLVYTPVRNTTTATKYIQVRLYNQGVSQDLYTSVGAGGTAYPAFYGINGAYSAYLYVWNGSSYQYIWLR